jgi:hypothetical protein
MEDKMKMNDLTGTEVIWIVSGVIVCIVLQNVCPILLLFILALGVLVFFVAIARGFVDVTVGAAKAWWKNP